MRTTIRLNDNLMIEAKQLAAQTGRTLTAVIEDGLREVLARGRRSPKKKRIVLPSHGSGGLQPGIDLSDSASLWELMDSEHAAR